MKKLSLLGWHYHDGKNTVLKRNRKSPFRTLRTITHPNGDSAPSLSNDLIEFMIGCYIQSSTATFSINVQN